MIDLERELQPVLDDATAPKPFIAVRQRATKLRRRRTARRAAAAGSVVALVVATIVVSRPHTSPDARVVTTPTTSPARLEIGTPATFRGYGLEDMIPAFGSIWASPPERVVRLDPADGHEVASIPVPGSSDFRNLAAGAGSIWVDDTGTQTITRIDAVTNRVVATMKVPGRFVIDGLAFVDEKVWVVRLEPTGARGEVGVIDPATNRVAEFLPAPRTFGVIAGSHALWYTGGDANSDLVRIDTNTRHISVPRHDVTAVLAAENGRLWLLTRAGVIETDEATGAQIGDAIPVRLTVNPAVTISPGIVWIAGQPNSSSPGSVTPYDLVTHQALHAPIPVGFPIVTMAATESAVWVLADGLTRIPLPR